VDDTWIADFLELGGEVGREDRVLVERVQAGVGSGAIDHGYARPCSEQLVLHFDGLLQTALDG
jgi:hypothetical protein